MFAAALFGTTEPLENLAPTWVYVVFWLGLPFLSFLLGDVWRALSPWRAIADGWVWLAGGRGGRDDPARSRAYPERLGRWPAAVALFAFVALELAYSDPSSPRVLAFAIAVYTYVTLARDGRVRPGDLDGAGGGVRGALPVLRADGAPARRERHASGRACRSPASAAPSACPARSPSSR